METLKLDLVRLPRVREIPQRFTGPAEAYHPQTIRDLFQQHYFKMFDVSIL